MDKYIVNFIINLTESKLINAIFFLLTLINTAYLVYSKFTNKPKLKAKPMFKDNAQMLWTIFPDRHLGDASGQTKRTYAFIPYMSVYNIGKKPVELSDWTLLIKSKIKEEPIELSKRPIQKVSHRLQGGVSMNCLVLGMNGNFYTIEPGSSMSGVSLYVHEEVSNFLKDKDEAISIDENNMVKCTFEITDLYGKTYKKPIKLKYQSYEEIQEFMPKIHETLYKE